MLADLLHLFAFVTDRETPRYINIRGVLMQLKIETTFNHANDELLAFGRHYFTPTIKTTWANVMT